MTAGKICFDPISKGFVIAKPIQWGEYDEKEIYELGKQERLIITRKERGWKLIAVKSKNRWKIYTDGPRAVTRYLPHIVGELNSLKVADNSMFIGEGIIGNTISDESKVGKILLTKDAAKAIKRQKEFGAIKFICFEVPFAGGECLLETVPYHERLTTALVTIGSRHSHIGTVEILRTTYDEAKVHAVKGHWEGLVLYDRDFRSSFRLDGGNPKRPNGCYKWKPLYEGDFFVREWIPSDTNPKLFKEILLLQLDPKTGKEVDCGKHVTFSAEKRAEIQKLLDKKKPFAVRFEYEGRTESNKMTNKRFDGVRYDKKWQDCLLPSKVIPKNMPQTK